MGENFSSGFQATDSPAGIVCAFNRAASFFRSLFDRLEPLARRNVIDKTPELVQAIPPKPDGNYFCETTVKLFSVFDFSSTPSLSKISCLVENSTCERGSVKYYRTQTSLYIPQPLEIRIVESDESPTTICNEILGLTKMNWNNTQFDGKYPITIACARKVGEVMKYLTNKDPEPQISYSFYM